MFPVSVFYYYLICAWFVRFVVVLHLLLLILFNPSTHSIQEVFVPCQANIENK